MEEKKVFRSRISVLLIGFVLVSLIPCSIPMLINKMYPSLYILGGTFVFIVFIFTRTRYIISDGKLYVKIGIIPFGSVAISKIVSMERSYNPLSSPACSLKRLRIDIEKEAKFPYLLISPVREQEFIEELKAVNPDISVHVPDDKGRWRVQDWDI
jgi:hypothetical protein